MRASVASVLASASLAAAPAGNSARCASCASSCVCAALQSLLITALRPRGAGLRFAAGRAGAVSSFSSAMGNLGSARTRKSRLLGSAAASFVSGTLRERS
ncbi:hypothetical protein B5U98_19490 [Bosea sp. Tri-39]|nr:hypothetical protein B5U98_19490 [Bosea sp. Tri-39]